MIDDASFIIFHHNPSSVIKVTVMTPSRYHHGGQNYRKTTKIVEDVHPLNGTQFHEDQPKRLQMDSLQILPWPSKCYMGLGIIISEQNCLCNSRTIVENPFQVWRTHLTFPVLVAKGSFVFKTTFFQHVGVSKNNGTPKSSILIGFSIINHPFWGTSIFGNTHVFSPRQDSTDTQQFVTLFFLRCSNFVLWSWHLQSNKKEMPYDSLHDLPPRKPIMKIDGMLKMVPLQGTFCG